MSINLDKLNTKLNAILSKDLDKIVSDGVYIPSLGNKYTKEELQAWLDRRSNFLKQAKTLTESQLTEVKDIIYQSLSSEQKRISDDILNDIKTTIVTESDWEKTTLIKLYKFIITK